MKTPSSTSSLPSISSSSSYFSSYLSLTYLYCFLFSFVIGVLFLSVPYRVLQITNDNKSAAAVIQAWTSSLSALLHFFMKPLYGLLSDYYGRRPFILITLCGFSLAMISMISTESIICMILLSIITGLTDTGFMMGFARLGDLSTPQQFIDNYGKMGSSIGLGLVLGSLIAIGLIEGDHTDRLSFGICLAISIINAIFVSIKMKESLGNGVRNNIQPLESVHASVTIDNNNNNADNDDVQA